VALPADHGLSSVEKMMVEKYMYHLNFGQIEGDTGLLVLLQIMPLGL
jgi:hypothetical protein